MHHGRIEMAHLPRGDLHRRQARLLKPSGILIGGQIPHQSRHPQTLRNTGGQPLQQGRLAGARGGEKIDHPHACRPEMLPVVGRLMVIAGQERLLQQHLAGRRWARKLCGSCRL